MLKTETLTLDVEQEYRDYCDWLARELPACLPVPFTTFARIYADQPERIGYWRSPLPSREARRA